MKIAPIFLIALAALCVCACGSGGGSDTAVSTATSGSSPAPRPAPAAPPAHRDSGGGASQFEVEGADNSIQESGSEASAGELAAAAIALHGYLDARAAGAWGDACSYMSARTSASLSQLASGRAGASCPQGLAALSSGLPAGVLRESAEADVGALRTQGEGGFLLFRGAHQQEYFMPMAREDGEWKVTALAPSALP